MLWVVSVCGVAIVSGLQTYGEADERFVCVRALQQLPPQSLHGSSCHTLDVRHAGQLRP